MYTYIQTHEHTSMDTNWATLITENYEEYLTRA